MSGLVKRETGESPVRTRHCEQGISESRKGHWITGRQLADVMICESGDLPGVYMEENSGPRVIGCTKMEYIILRPFYTLLRMISWKGFLLLDHFRSFGKVVCKGFIKTTEKVRERVEDET